MAQVFSPQLFQTVVGYLLGIFFGAGLTIFCYSESFDIGLYLLFLSVFHFWEYVYVALFRPEELTYNCEFYSGKKKIFTVKKMEKKKENMCFF